MIDAVRPVLATLRAGILLAAAALLVAAAPPRIVAIGDLHGDSAAWRQIAQAAQLIDASGRWVGRNAVLVQTGDVVDRGPDSLGIVRDLMRLQREAPRTGGRVVALVGNHEAMNVTDDLRYVTPGDYAAFADAKSSKVRDRAYIANRDQIEASYRKRDPSMTGDAIRAAWLKATPLGLVEHQAAWHATGWIGRWVAANPAVVVLDGTLFVHGGISAAYASVPVAEINRRVAAALVAGDTARGAIINDPLGPLWYRGLVAPEPDVPPPPPDELAQVLRATGASRMVVGHTPILSGIALKDGGKLACIDTGISAYYGGKLSYLEILDGRFIPHEVERQARP